MDMCSRCAPAFSATEKNIMEWALRPTVELTTPTIDGMILLRVGMVGMVIARNVRLHLSTTMDILQ